MCTADGGSSRAVSGGASTGASMKMIRTRHVLSFSYAETTCLSPGAVKMSFFEGYELCRRLRFKWPHGLLQDSEVPSTDSKPPFTPTSLNTLVRCLAGAPGPVPSLASRTSETISIDGNPNQIGPVRGPDRITARGPRSPTFTGTRVKITAQVTKPGGRRK